MDSTREFFARKNKYWGWQMNWIIYMEIILVITVLLIGLSVYLNVWHFIQIRKMMMFALVNIVVILNFI